VKGLGRRTKKNREPEVRLFFATDIHGSDRCFRKFLNAANFYGAKYLVMGGDITGKTMVPIERNGSGYKVSLDGREHSGLDEAERARVEQQIRDYGQYPIVGTAEELAQLEDQATREARFTEVTLASIKRWVEMAEERLGGTDVRCFITPGNDDVFEIDEVLAGCSAVEFVEGTRVALDDDHEMITTGYSNPTPWDTPRELEEEALAARIRKMSAELENPSSALMVLHPPPFGSLLDQAPALDEDLNMEVRGGNVQMASVGSRAVREVIEEAQPLLALHGHVHESAAEQKLGRTWCINPGSEYTSGILRGALVGLAPDEVVTHQLVSG
jgi:uncharacterized protein